MHPHTLREVEKAKRRFLVAQTDDALKMIRTLDYSYFHEGFCYCVETDANDVETAVALFRESGIAAGTRTSDVRL